MKLIVYIFLLPFAILGIFLLVLGVLFKAAGFLLLGDKEDAENAINDAYK